MSAPDIPNIGPRRRRPHPEPVERPPEPAADLRPLELRRRVLLQVMDGNAVLEMGRRAHSRLSALERLSQSGGVDHQNHPMRGLPEGELEAAAASWHEWIRQSRTSILAPAAAMGLGAVFADVAVHEPADRLGAPVVITLIGLALMCVYVCYRTRPEPDTARAATRAFVHVGHAQIEQFIADFGRAMERGDAVHLRVLPPE